MRDDVMLGLVQRTIEDQTFREQALQDLDGTLRAAGYDLNEDEVAAVREFQGQVGGMSAGELKEHLETLRHRGGA